MSDIDYTLFENVSDNSNGDYSLQIETSFNQNIYSADGAVIISQPGSATGTVEVRLKLKNGSDSAIIHDFPLDFQFSYTPHWKIDIQYEDDQGVVVKKKKENTEQAEIVSVPRPINSAVGHE